MLVEPVGNAMPPDCMDPGIRKYNFEQAARSGIIFENGSNVRLD
jgi:hypothetical protein